MKPFALTIAFACVMWPATSQASGHASSSSHFSSRGSSSSSQHRSACHDTSDVVGLENCTRFGSRWDISDVATIVFDLSASYRYLTVGDHVFTSSGVSGLAIAGSALPGRSVSVVTGDMRFAFIIARYARVGIEGSIGDAILSGTTPVNVGPSTAVVGGGLYLSVGAYAGAGFDLGPWALSAETLVGVRNMNVAASVQGSDGRVSMSTAGDTRAYFEPRLVLEYRALPWTSVGVFAGLEYAGSIGGVVGLLVRAHSRAYDGRRDP